MKTFGELTVSDFGKKMRFIGPDFKFEGILLCVEGEMLPTKHRWAHFYGHFDKYIPIDTLVEVLQ